MEGRKSIYDGAKGEITLLQIHKKLIFSKKKKIPLHVLEKQFPTTKNLKNVLFQFPSLFWLGETHQNILEVRPKVKARLCVDYPDGTCAGDCDKIHMCRDNLLSPQFCKAPCKYKLSHNIDDVHNRKVLQSAFPKDFHDGGGKVKILRSSFPRLCRSFTIDGTCTSSCGYLHICPEFIRGICTNCKQAKLSNISNKTTHNFEIGHNKRVLRSFNLSSSNSDRSEILGNILINDAQQARNGKDFSQGMDYRSIQLHSQSMSDIFQKPSDIESAKRRSLTKSTSSISLNNPVNTSTIKKVKISICHYYLNEECKNRSCRRLHVCKEYLAGACKISECAFGFSHDLLDDHNKRITEKIKACHSKKDAFAVVRSHLPHLCEDYSVTGKCHWGNECWRVHICKEFLLDSLCNPEECSRSHNLLDKHNLSIARKYSNILDIKGSKGQKIDYFKADIVFSKFNNTKKDNAEYVSQPCETVNKSLSETSVFSYILNNGVDGVMPLIDLLSQFENNEKMALSWFRRHSKSFRLTHDTTTKKQSIHLCLENVLPCYNYWTEIGCNVSCCKMFHICKKFLHGIPHSEISCKYDHNVDELVKSELASEHNLRSLSSDHLLLLLKSRLPFVCKKNLSEKCDAPDGTCPDIHICGDFIAGECKKADGLCSHKHHSALATKHSADVMNSYHIPRWDYFKCIIYVKEQTTQSFPNEAESTAQFNSLKDEAICYRYINDDCMEGSSCRLLHPDPRFPFLWQYRKMEVWTNFPASISTELEKFFCDPNNGDDFSASKEEALTVDFSGNVAPWKGCYGNNQVDIRRLSTMSSIHTKDDSIVGLTQWKWYWKSDKGGWDEYNDTDQLEIEKTFLDEKSTGYKFQTIHHGYLLSFETMEQQNLGPKYFTKRNVRRRPKFQDLDSICKSKEVQDEQLLSHWPKNFEDGTRISIADKDVKKGLKANFLKSINKDVTIVSVKEICNDVHYRKYVNCKCEFIKRLGEGNIKEMFLYHGTSPASVEAIRKQNFDWRLNGMQGVVYGKGSYFARDASYSDSYARPDVNGHQHMFVAQVLVGNYTRGNSSMSRPPEDTSFGTHRLFDSCVNNVRDPSIYVIFERDQAYPRYLIKYWEQDTSEFIPSSTDDLKVGTKVKTSLGTGTIRWLGQLPYFGGLKALRIGVEFTMAVGDTDGLWNRDNVYYFRCQPNHGAYIMFSDIKRAYK